MKLDEDWTITLFPTMPLALLAAVQITPSPALVLVEEDSVLNGHVSALCLPPQGYLIRTFNEQTNLDRAGRAELTPSNRLAVHRDLGALNMRISDRYDSRTVASIWNHIENLTERDLVDFPTQFQVRPKSATLRLPGCPGAVALFLERKGQAQIADIAEALGLHYQDGPSV